MHWKINNKSINTEKGCFAKHKLDEKFDLSCVQHPKDTSNLL